MHASPAVEYTQPHPPVTDSMTRASCKSVHKCLECAGPGDAEPGSLQPRPQLADAHSAAPLGHQLRGSRRHRPQRRAGCRHRSGCRLRWGIRQGALVTWNPRMQFQHMMFRRDAAHQFDVCMVPAGCGKSTFMRRMTSVFGGSPKAPEGEAFKNRFWMDTIPASCMPLHAPPCKTQLSRSSLQSTMLACCRRQPRL